MFNKLVAGLLNLQLRFLAWQLRLVGPRFPAALDQVARGIDDIAEYEARNYVTLPRETRIAISKLVVARRRGI